MILVELKEQYQNAISTITRTSSFDEVLILINEHSSQEELVDISQTVEYLWDE